MPTEAVSNASTYSWDELVGVPEVQTDVQIQRTYTTNGLNQYTNAGGPTLSYDANGNLTSDGNTQYVYDVENRLVKATGGGVENVNLQGGNNDSSLGSTQNRRLGQVRIDVEVIRGRNLQY